VDVLNIKYSIDILNMNIPDVKSKSWKQILFKTNTNALQLGLVSFIVKENMYKLSNNLNIYKEVLNKKYDKVSFKRPKSEKKLPRVIDSNLIIERLNKIENIKHKAILTLTYSVGLRVSEITNLKIEDINSKRMLIHIKNAKGKKDRIVPLSETVLSLLRDYYKQYKPTEYLFNGLSSNQYSIQSCQKLYKKYIDQNSSIHTLRHSSFTNLLESGTDLRIIQTLAGHKSTKTTEIYTHVSTQILSKVKLPI
jgi:site-specific recombinase XerD